jgi:uncharacterized membrane protein YwaF
VAAIIILWLTLRKKFKGQQIVFYIITSILTFFELASRCINLAGTNDFSFKNIYQIIMPIHLCSIVVITIIISWFCQIKSLLNASFIVGFFATIIFLLYPAVGFNTKIIGFSQLYSITSHSLGMVLVMLLFLWHRVDLRITKVWQPLLLYGCSLLNALILNLTMYPTANYLYFMEDVFGWDINIWLYRFILLSILLLTTFAWYTKDIVLCIRKNIVNRKQIIPPPNG